MLRTTIAALALASSALTAVAATDEELREQIVGPWGPDETCAEGNLTFNADGTYAIVRPDDDPETGTWTIAEGIITATDQPTSSVTIDGDRLVLGDPKGGPRGETFIRCPG